MRNRSSFFAGTFAALTMFSPARAAKESALPNPTDAWNYTWTEVLVDLWVIGIFFGAAAIFMLIKYRAKRPEDIGKARKLTLGQALAWCLVPTALFLADDFLLAAKGWSLWNIQRTVPAGAMEIKVTASQWAFNFEYPDGVEVDSTDRSDDADLFSQEIMDGDMVVPVGQAIVLRMTSTDTLHSFGLTHYRLKEDIMPGRITYLWFTAREPKVSTVVCVEFCGTNHAQMFNRVVAVARPEYEAWITRKKQEAALDRPRLAAGANGAVKAALIR